MARSVTLIELLVAVSLIALVLLAAAVLYTGSISFFSSFEFQTEMQHRANIALQDMVNSIFLAKRVELGGSNSELRVWTSEVDSFKYWLDGSQIKRGEELDYEVIGKGVKQLTFFLAPASPPESYFDILDISLSIDGMGKLADFWLSTKIAIREYE